MSNLANFSPTQHKTSVLFDMDGTLLDLSFDNYIWMQLVPNIWAQQHQISLHTAKQQLYQYYQTYQGSLDWYSSTFWANKLGIDVLALQTQYQHLIATRPQCLELLKHLTDLGIECWLITNADQATLSLKLENIALRPYFKHIISSETLGFPKESQQFWIKLNQLYSFNPRQCYFIDDNYHVLESAQQYGIRQLFSITQPDMHSQRQLIHPEYIHLDELTTLLEYL